MLKFLQAHVIAHVYILVLDGYLETSQARSSFAMIFVEGWDEPGIVDLAKGVLGGVLDGVDSTGVDESTSTIWTAG